MFFKKNETKEEIKNNYIEETKNEFNITIEEDDIDESKLYIELIDVDNNMINFFYAFQVFYTFNLIF